MISYIYYQSKDGDILTVSYNWLPTSVPEDMIWNGKKYYLSN